MGILTPPQSVDPQKSASFAPVTNAVTQEQMVSGQMTDLLNKKSPFMQLAETKANQESNSRGILNSSMAVGAAHNAAIQSALPIAQQDADTQFKSSLTNMDAINRTKGAAQQQSYDVTNNAAQMAHEADIEQYKQRNLAFSQMVKGISDINMQDLDPTAKENATATLWEYYTKGSPIYNSLGGSAPAAGASSSPATVAAPATSTSTTASPTTQLAQTAAPTPQNKYATGILSYSSKAEMNDIERYVFEQKYGTAVEPKQVAAALTENDALISRLPAGWDANPWNKSANYLSIYRTIQAKYGRSVADALYVTEEPDGSGFLNIGTTLRQR